MTIGSNNVENHPLSSRWCHRAVDRGAKWIVVDPRFTRTASQADMYAPIRPGTDIAFFGGMIHYILEKKLYQKEYVMNYTNATFLIDPSYKFDVADGLFSGWEEKEKAYSNKTDSLGHSLGISAGIRSHHKHCRRRYIGILRHRQCVDSKQSREHHQNRQNGGENGALYEESATYSSDTIIRK